MIPGVPDLTKIFSNITYVGTSLINLYLHRTEI